MKKMNKKGFTLIELLAVIIILGVLMIIAIPSVTTYIQNSRKSAYVDTAVAYIDAVKTKVNEGKSLQLYSTDALYLIPVGDKMFDGSGNDKGSSCVSVESGGQSPFSDKWKYAYVGVTYDGKGWNYFFIGEDGAGQGLPFIDRATLADDGNDYIYSSVSEATEKVKKLNVSGATEFPGNLKTVLTGEYKKDKTNSVYGTTDGTLGINGTDLAYLQAYVGSKSVVVTIGACSYTGE